jgi:hypothetical protein
MGKLIAFPRARIVGKRTLPLGSFQAFNELELLERAELKLVAACCSGALLLTAALQLTLL